MPKAPSDRRAPNDIPERERFYFLEEWYPTYGNTVARDVASRAIWKAVRDMGMGVGGEDKVYLDLTHLDPAFVDVRLGAILPHTALVYPCTADVAVHFEKVVAGFSQPIFGVSSQ